MELFGKALLKRVRFKQVWMSEWVSRGESGNTIWICECGCGVFVVVEIFVYLGGIAVRVQEAFLPR